MAWVVVCVLFMISTGYVDQAMAQLCTHEKVDACMEDLVPYGLYNTSSDVLNTPVHDEQTWRNEICPVIESSYECVGKFRDFCSTDDYWLWIGREEADKYLCEKGLNAYLNSQQCVENLLNTLSIKCHDVYYEQLASLTLTWDSTKLFCRYTTDYLSCVSDVVRTGCGEEAATFEEEYNVRLFKMILDQMGCEVDVCNPKCQNGGECKDGFCNCPPGLIGLTCDKPQPGQCTDEAIYQCLKPLEEFGFLPVDDSNPFQELVPPNLTREKWMEICSIEAESNLCIRKIRETCASHDQLVMIGADDADHYLCNAGFEKFIRNEHCISEGYLAENIRKCEYNLLNDIDNLDRYSSRSKNKMCSHIKDFLSCIDNEVEDSCGTEAADFISEYQIRLWQPTADQISCELSDFRKGGGTNYTMLAVILFIIFFIIVIIIAIIVYKKYKKKPIAQMTQSVVPPVANNAYFTTVMPVAPGAEGFMSPGHMEKSQMAFGSPPAYEEKQSVPPADPALPPVHGVPSSPVYDNLGALPAYEEAVNVTTTPDPTPPGSNPETNTQTMQDTQPGTDPGATSDTAQLYEDIKY